MQVKISQEDAYKPCLLVVIFNCDLSTDEGGPIG